MSTWIEEGKWDCTQCATVNRGRDKSCVTCGGALESDERIYFDSPPSPSQRVTDAALIEQFEAGPDWECPYCEGKQRNDRGACVNCGGSKAVSEEPEAPSHADGDSPSPRPAPRGDRPKKPTSGPSVSATSFDRDAVDDFHSANRRAHRAKAVAIGSVAMALVVGTLYVLFRTTEKELTVASVQWSRTVEVERYRIVHEEGFDADRPTDAMNVQSLGSRHHHYRDYQCGTQQESYTDREQCGETCRTTPVRCTSNRNGSRTCSGGDRECSPKYCSVTKHRTVPKMCQESITKPYSAWDVWRWRHDRDVPVSGISVDSARWPTDGELQIGAHGMAGQQERIGKRSEVYAAKFRDSDGETYDFTPSSEAEFRTLPVGSMHRVRYSIAKGVQLGLH